MYQPSRWGFGFFFLVPLCLIAFATTVDSIEKDLTRRSLAVLSSENYDGLKLSAHGRDVYLSGAAFYPEGKSQAERSISTLFGVRRLTNKLTFLSMKSPYETYAEITPQQIILTGVIPNPVIDQTLKATLKALRPEVRDETNYATSNILNFNVTFESAAPKLFSFLNYLSSGKVSLADYSYSIVGTAATSRDYESLMLGIKQAPKEYKAREIAVSAPVADRLNWSVRSNGKKLSLSGFVPDLETRATQILKTVNLNPQQELENQLQFAQVPQIDYYRLSEFEQAAISVTPNLQSVEISVSGKEISATGLLKEGLDPTQTIQRLESALPSGFSWKILQFNAPRVDPFVIDISHSGENIIWSGFVPQSSEVSAVLQKVSMQWPGAKISQHLTYASGLPADLSYDTLANGMIAILAQLQRGEIRFEGDRLKVSGGLPENIDPGQWMQTLRTHLPKGVTMIDFSITSEAAQTGDLPNLAFIAQRDNGSLELVGAVQNEAERKEILALIAPNFGSIKIIDGLTIDGNVDSGSFLVIKSGLQQLARLRSGQLRVTNEALDLRGLALYDRAANDIARALHDDLDRRFKVSTTLTTLAQEPLLNAVQCQEQLSGDLASHAILFESGKALVQNDSFGLLDSLAADARRCAAAHFDIAGHTDSEGDSASNMELSRARAEAIANYLEQAGIAPDHIKTHGFGDTKPVADNNTAHGRAQNRRIEIIVSE